MMNDIDKILNVKKHDIKEGVKYSFNNSYYFVIYEYDIRIFNKDNNRVMFDINTYPYYPQEVLINIITLH